MCRLGRPLRRYRITIVAPLQAVVILPHRVRAKARVVVSQGLIATLARARGSQSTRHSIEV